MAADGNAAAVTVAAATVAAAPISVWRRVKVICRASKSSGSLGAVVFLSQPLHRFNERVVVLELFDRKRKLDFAGAAAGQACPPV
jgi:hypothetical protein